MRQNPHVRICGGPGSATTLVYPTSWSCGGDGTAPVVSWIGNMFPPPPLFLHEPGRFQGTQADPSRLDG